MIEDWALPEIDLQRCDRCGICVEQCPTNAVEMGPEGPFIGRPADCTYCASCDALCPQGAITCTFEIVWESHSPSASGGGGGNGYASAACRC